MIPVTLKYNGIRYGVRGVHSDVFIYRIDGLANIQVTDKKEFDEVLTEATRLRKIKANAKRRIARRARNQVMSDLGLVKVRSASGKVYWE